ncbi:Sporulation related domain-containing protein [Solimonas aquatica]|uniref:Sporulation related domain-containing protein n=1 Tax=Solimonas aquatica TaxID=489703 RepID=A0A1H9M065_9GAMM|nr:SPOR domain-containing protein [Solimonas aquatica]SER17058.1 Sporulation related domain-containing protein [Solimonas aquatica]
MRRMVAGLSLAMAGVTAAAAEPAAILSVQRSEGNVLAVSAQQIALPLSEHSPIPVKTLLRNDLEGRLALVVNGGGHLVLGGDSELLVQDLQPGEAPARSALLRLQLKSGALLVDARKLEQAAPADVRLQLPLLSMRIYGGNAWLQSGPDGDEVCALAGAVEVDTPSGHDRLDRPGECLRWYEQGGEHLGPGRRQGLALDTLRTSFSDDREAQYAARQALTQPGTTARSTPPAVATTPPVVPPPIPAAPAPAPVAPAAAPVTPQPAPAPASEETIASPAPAAPAALTPAPAPPQAATPTRWSLVLGSFNDKALAQQALTRWRARGFKLRLLQAPGVNQVYYRVLAGEYPSRAAADEALRRLQRKAEFKNAWVLGA